MKFPESGIDRDVIFKELAQKKQTDPKWHDGQTLSLVYHYSDEHLNFLKEVYGLYMQENGLNPLAFKSLKVMEDEVIQMALDLFHAPDTGCGAVTTGGTESILLALRTYKEYGKKIKGIKNPEAILPITAHPAFMKACDYFSIKPVIIDSDGDYRVDCKKVKAAINKNTIVLVGSAPQFPQGVLDPIEELSALALEFDIPLHVDACVGGFYLPFMKNPPIFDFRISGVTSISADLHKYGYAAKGASTISYRDMKYMQHQFFVYENWPGGVYVTANIPGSKSGGSIACAWATMKYFGKSGYEKLTQDTQEVANFVMDKINSFYPLAITGKPIMSIFGFQSLDPNFDIYRVAEIMHKNGWQIDKQIRPRGLHMMITINHKKVAEKLCHDLKLAVEEVLKSPSKEVSEQVAMYGMMSDLPFRGVIKNEILKFFMNLYKPGASLNDTDKSGSDAPPKAVLKIMGWYSKALAWCRSMVRS
jgi:sphinganine-1-phosphate aldolase